jgi:uncharacterized membrane protein
MSTAPSPQLAWVDRSARAIIRHWLFIVNSMAVLYAALPWLGPILQNAGYTRLGRLIFVMYRPLCHQLPERSFFVGTSQVCYCHRCTALYTAIALAGLLYGALRWRLPISNRMLGWAALPMLIDGLRHVVSDYVPGLVLRSVADGVGSLNFWLRIGTGVIFGVAAVLWLHPRMHQTFAEV